MIEGVKIKNLVSHNDEFRIPYDDSKINFDWLSGPTIK